MDAFLTPLGTKTQDQELKGDFKKLCSSARGSSTFSEADFCPLLSPLLSQQLGHLKSKTLDFSSDGKTSVSILDNSSRS